MAGMAGRSSSAWARRQVTVSGAAWSWTGRQRQRRGPGGQRRGGEAVRGGEGPGRGLRRGMVVDRGAAIESVAEAIEACGGAMLGGPVSVGIAGGHISSYNTEVTLLNRSRDRIVTDRLVRRLEAEARRAEIREDESVIHVVPRSFVLDGAEGVRQPVGLAAKKATMRAHVVSGAVSTIQNLLGVVEDCGGRVERKSA